MWPRALNVPFVDATKITHDIETGLGIKGSRKVAHVVPAWARILRFLKGKQDNTHYNVYGARVVANALADALAEQVPALKKHVRHYDYVVLVQKGQRKLYEASGGSGCGSCQALLPPSLSWVVNGRSLPIWRVSLSDSSSSLGAAIE